MNDEDYAFEMGVSYLMTEKYELAIRSFKEVISLNPKHVQAIHNLMFTLQEQRTASTTVSCPHCDHKWDVDIYPTNHPVAFVQKASVAATFAEVPVSSKMLDCPNCNADVTYTFSLCCKCYDGWPYYNLAKITMPDEKEVWNPIRGQCQNCGHFFIERKYKDPEDIALFNELSKHR